MEAIAKLLRFNHPAKNKLRQVILKEPVDRYLNSPQCAEKLRNQTIFGSITHTLRHSPEGRLGTNDKMLLDGPIILKVTDMWTTPEYLMGRIEIFDNLDEYEGKHKEIVANIIKLIRSGSNIGLSSVIQAYWNNDHTLAELVSFNGVDFTLSPSFEGCELVEVTNRRMGGNYE
jgi:hypothetical protein